MPIISAENLRRLTCELFQRMGVPSGPSFQVSSSIVDNCLYGHDSHGAALIPRFIRDLELGKIDPDAETEVIRTSGATARVNGHRGFGQITMVDAMNTSIGMAKESGIAAVTVTNCNHVGILWTYAKMAAEAGVIGMIWCGSGPQGGFVAPYGGIKRAIGVNPIAVGIPAGEAKPLVLDISTAMVAGGKVMLYARQGKSIPLGWILDDDGNPTTDPKELVAAGQVKGALLPMAGHKGFGLGLVVEILGNVLSGYGATCRPDYREGNGVFIVAIDIARFLPPEEFGAEVDRVFRHVKAVPTDAETDEILIPGELEFRTRVRRECDGIPVDDVIWGELMGLAEKLGVDVEGG